MVLATFRWVLSRSRFKPSAAAVGEDAIVLRVQAAVAEAPFAVHPST
jgi:hypothetical protein